MKSKKLKLRMSGGCVKVKVGLGPEKKKEKAINDREEPIPEGT